MRQASHFLLTLALIVGATQSASAQAKKQPIANDVFGLTKIHDFHFELTTKEWSRMQQVRGGMPFGGFGGKKTPAPLLPPGDEPLEFHKSSGFGTEFPWAHAELSAPGKTYKNVGLRYKGNGSYMTTSNQLKRNLRIDLDHYNEDLRFHGLKSITLNAGAMDPQRMREAVAYAVFREAGVPAPRTSFANVTLTVPGKYDKEFVGVYTFVEHVDKSFLKDRFGNNKGLLLKPERMQGLEYLGESWDKYKAKYQPKHEPTAKETKHVIEFVKLVNKSSTEEFQKEIGTYLDVDQFLRFLAANALVANQDSFFTLGHNYFMYLNPKTFKIVFFPWDLDLSFGSFPMAGSAAQQMELSIDHPYAGNNKLTDRLLADKKVLVKYHAILTELTASCFAKEKLFKDIEAIEQAIKPSLAREKQAVAARKDGGGGFGFGMFGAGVDLRTFVQKRGESALAQLAGTSKGYVPTMGFGFPGGGFKGPPGGFGQGNLAKPLVAELDANTDSKLAKDEFITGVKRLFAGADKGKKGSLDERTLAEALARLFAPAPGFGPPPKGPAFGPKTPGSGRGALLAGAIMKRADADKDGKLTQNELVSAAELLFKELDNDKKGVLDEGTVAAGINLLMPRPVFNPLPGGEPKKKD